MLGDLTERLHRLLVVARRATLAPLLVRCGIFLSGLLALMVAFPTAVVASQFLVLLVIAAAVPALAPRGRAGTALVVVAVAGWILDTTYVNQPVVLDRVLTLATALYVGHSLTALAAVLPPDATVSLNVVTRWLARAAGVVLTSAVIIVIALSLTTDLAGRTFVLASLVGLAAAVGATALLTRLLHKA
jgi:hypothetical protein